MLQLPFLGWVLILAALVVGILAGHFGWGRRWPPSLGKLHPDYLTGLDYLVTEQPDRALDMFLKLMDASADTIETHFALGSLYRRRGEVERAIRIHQNLLERLELAPEHREQALLALARDYLRAGVLDRAETLLQEVSKVTRLRGSALDALRGVYERQHEWQQALTVYRQLARAKGAPGRNVAAHYLCELASGAMDRGDIDAARRLLHEARNEVPGFARAALLRAHIAQREGDRELAVRLLKTALDAAPVLLQDELRHLVALQGEEQRDRLLGELAAHAEQRGFADLKRLVFAAIDAQLSEAVSLQPAIETVLRDDAALRPIWESVQRAGSTLPSEALPRLAAEIGALLSQAEKYRCTECGFAGRSFYWHCPACHAWDSFEAYAIITLK